MYKGDEVLSPLVYFLNAPELALERLLLLGYSMFTVLTLS